MKPPLCKFSLRHFDVPFTSSSTSQRIKNPKVMVSHKAGPSTSAKVEKFQQVLHSDGTGGSWQKCWEEGLTPWDLKQPTPVLMHMLNQKGSNSKREGFDPWLWFCGYDVVAIAGPERYAVGLDISETAIEQAMKLSSPSSNGGYFEFLKTDFFTWRPTELFDFIFDYTFFCALEPEPHIRSSWAVRMRDLLKPDGELMTLMFPISDHKGGPPYKVSVADYEEVLHPVGFEAISVVDNELAVAARKGAEKVGRWKRTSCVSSL